MKAVHQLRRRITNATLAGALGLTRFLPDGLIHSFGSATGALVSLGFHSRLKTNMRLALGDFPELNDAVHAWFRRFSTYVAWSGSVYHRGLWNSSAASRITLHDSVAHLDEAVAGGQGVVVAAPHLFCHEIGAGVISRRHPVTALVRESRQPGKQRIKLRWYEALGVETIVLARELPVSAVVRKCLRLLKEGRVLGITPDLIVHESDSVNVRIFGRDARMKAGLVALSAFSGAPLVTCLGNWVSDSHGELLFTPPKTIRLPADRSARSSDAVEQTLRSAFQLWLDEFETYLRANPENWLFWLDKRWTELIRSQPVTACLKETA